MDANLAMVDELGLCGRGEPAHAWSPYGSSECRQPAQGLRGLPKGMVADVAELSVVDGRRWTEVQSNRFGTLG